MPWLSISPAWVSGNPTGVFTQSVSPDGRTPGAVFGDHQRVRWRDKGREVIDGLYPTDDGLAHFGLLGAGSREGSVAAFRGTSMAAAQATCAIAVELLAGGDGSSAWLRAQARARPRAAGGPSITAMSIC